MSRKLQHLVTPHGAIFIVLVACLWAVGGCERAGEDDGSTVETIMPPAEALPGFVIGQVTTVPGPRAQRPIDGLDDGEVGRRFRAAVRDLPTFEEEGGEGPAIDFTLEVSAGIGLAEPPPAVGTGQPAVPEGDVEYVVLMLAAEGRAYRDPRYQFEVRGLYRERVTPGETPLETTRRLVEHGVADLAEGLLAETAPRVASDDEVVDMLSSDDPDQLLPAIREVHRRRIAAAAPALRNRLGGDDIEVIIAAATALGRIRDEGAVRPLVDLISREHRELKELILPIIGEINSVSARSYLQAVVDDEYEHPAIRQLARELLEQNAP